MQAALIITVNHSSVVPESAMVPFCPGREPFQSYTRHVRRFTSDLGVSRAVRYWQAGIIPEGFKWLRASAKKRMDVEEEEEEEEGQEKEKGEEGKGKEERDGQSERREDHSRVTEEEEIVIETTPIRKRAITANGSFSGGKGKNTTCKKTSTSPTMPRTKPRSKRVEKPSSGGATTHSGNGGGTGAPSIICLPSYKEPRKFYLLASLLPVALPR